MFHSERCSDKVLQTNSSGGFKSKPKVSDGLYSKNAVPSPSLSFWYCCSVMCADITPNLASSCDTVLWVSENTAILDQKPIFQYGLITTHWAANDPAFLNQMTLTDSKNEMSYVVFLPNQVQQEREWQASITVRSKTVDTEWGPVHRFPQTLEKREGGDETGLKSQMVPGELMTINVPAPTSDSEIQRNVCLRVSRSTCVVRALAVSLRIQIEIQTFPHMHGTYQMTV